MSAHLSFFEKRKPDQGKDTFSPGLPVFSSDYCPPHRQDWAINAKVLNDGVILYKTNRVGGAGSYHVRNTEDCKRKSFGAGAQKRLKNALDNFCNVYGAAKRKDKELLRYSFNGSSFYRRPVLITLTVPKQSKNYRESDLIAKAGLDLFLRNLRQTYNRKIFIWKAEAQERGNIHFHIVSDCFIDQEKGRQLWFKFLAREKMLLPGQILKNASRIFWVNEIKSLDSLKFYLMGYLCQKRNDEGDLISKHNKNKTVRDIEGMSWGCSDNLKNPGLTFEDISDSQINFLRERAVSLYPERPDDLDFFQVVTLKRSKVTIKKTKGGLFGDSASISKTYKTHNNFPGRLLEALDSFHLKTARLIYA